jgi:hemoglobin/transferrin/lactoferrin receptor protein
VRSSASPRARISSTLMPVVHMMDMIKVGMTMSPVQPCFSTQTLFRSLRPRSLWRSATSSPVLSCQVIRQGQFQSCIYAVGLHFTGMLGWILRHPSNHKSANQQTNKQTNQSTTNQPTNQPTHQPTNQPTNQPTKERRRRYPVSSLRSPERITVITRR